MADLKVTRFVIGGESFVIPAAASDQAGLMSPEDFQQTCRHFSRCRS